MLLRIIETNTTRVVGLFLLLVIITDFIHKTNSIIGFNSLRTPLILKSIMLVTFFCFLAIKLLYENIEKKAFFLIVILLILNLLSNYSLNLSDQSFFNTLYIQIQFLFGLLVILFFNFFRPFINIKPLTRLISILVVINFIFIMAGYVFDVSIFKTYFYRFGFNGFFKSTSVATYFYMFVILLFYIRENTWSKVFLAISVASAFFVGSKTLYLFLCLFGLYYCYFLVFKKAKLEVLKHYKIVVFVGLSLIIITCFFIVVGLNETIFKVYSKDGFISAFFSYRNRLAIQAIEDITTKWKPINYLIGGMGIIGKTTEIDLMDLILNYGIIGTMVYAYIFLNNLRSYFNHSTILLFTPIIISVLIRGNFLYYPSVIYLSILIFVLINKPKINLK